MDNLKMMTGEEFLNKVRATKTITDISWNVTGDVLDPEEVKVRFIADGEPIEILYPAPGENPDDHFIQFSALSLILNKFMEQIGTDFRTNHADKIAKAINYSRQQVKGR